MDTGMDALPKKDAGTAAQGVDGAVGVSGVKNWFVAIVNNKAERSCAKKLEHIGYECYVPTQEEVRLWRTGVRKIVERVIFPAIIFIRTTEKERRKTVVNFPYIKRFMVNKSVSADSFGKHPVAIIPDDQIQRLKYILGYADAAVEFDSMAFKLGDRVRIARGGLIGMEGNIIECGDVAYFAIQVDFLGVAKVVVKKEDLELIK